MDTHFPNLHDDLDALRLYARLVCPDRAKEAQLLEQTLVEAIRLAQAGKDEDDRAAWLLRLICDLARGCGCESGAPDEHEDPLVAALHRLPMPDREVLAVIDVLGFDAERAAGILGGTENAMRVRHTAARRALKAQLACPTLARPLGRREGIGEKGAKSP